LPQKKRLFSYTLLNSLTLDHGWHSLCIYYIVLIHNITLQDNAVCGFLSLYIEALIGPVLFFNIKNNWLSKGRLTSHLAFWWWLATTESTREYSRNGIFQHGPRASKFHVLNNEWKSRPHRVKRKATHGP
jgi:hypothetical protein